MDGIQLTLSTANRHGLVSPTCGDSLPVTPGVWRGPLRSMRAATVSDGNLLGACVMRRVHLTALWLETRYVRELDEQFEVNL